MTPLQATITPSYEISALPLPPAIILPYHTTSQQAVDTLSSGIAFPVSRSTRQLSHSLSKKKSQKSLKQKKTSRLGFCICGSNVGMYDDGDRKSEFDQKSRAQQARDVELKGMTMNPIEDACTIVFGEADEIASSNALTQVPKETQPCSPNASVTDDDLSATSTSPKAQVLTAVRLDKSQTALPSRVLTSENDRHSFAANLLLSNHRTKNAKSQDASTSTNESSKNVEDVSQGTIRPLPSLPMEMEDRNELSIKQTLSRSRRRGGFISTSSDNVPMIDIEEPSIDAHSSRDNGEDQVEVMSSTSETPYASLASSPARFSVASSASIYSTASPYIQSPFIPHLCPPGRTTMGATSDTLSAFHSHSSPTVSKSSVATSDATDSDNDSLSNESSNQSPPMGDVLSRFPNLIGTDTQIKTALLHFTSSPCPSSDFNDDDDLSSRIHTFGPTGYAMKQYEQSSNLDSPARTNSFLYDDDDLTFSIEQQQSLKHQSEPPSTGSSVDDSSAARSRKIQKRGAVFCGFPSVASSLVSAKNDGDADLRDCNWQDNLLDMARQQLSSSQTKAQDDEHRFEQANFFTDISKAESRARSSLNNQAPYSMPPDLPLPPIPTLSRKSSHYKGSHHLRPCHSLKNAAKLQFSSPAQLPLHHSMNASFPRSSTCPDLATMSSGYAF